MAQLSEILNFNDMKKSLLIKRISVLFFALITFWQIGAGQALLVENFDYASGALLTANGWTAHSGSGTQAINVVVPGLSFTGYPSSGIGGAALVDNNGEDVHRTFTTQTSGTVYAAFLVNVTTPAEGYFLHLGGNPIGTTFRAKLSIIGTTSPFNFGISVGSNTPTPVSGGSYTSGTTYLFVIKYEIVSGTNNDIVSLFISPGTIPTSEPGTPTIGPLTDATQTDINPGSIALRQYSATQNIVIDGIRIATTWTDAISDFMLPCPTFNPANSATDVAVAVTPTITFDEPVRKTDGNPLENSDLASLITFKKGNSGGTNVAFTAAIDAGKKVITVTPSASLDNSQSYYLAVGAVEDGLGNENTGSNITFTTIAAATPSVTITAPTGGETFYAGDNVNITWTSANITNVRIDAWVVSGDRTWKWENLAASIPAAAGVLNFTIPADALYGTLYQIGISDAANGAVNSLSGAFTLIAVANSLENLRTRCILDDIVKLSSEVTMTFKRATGNNKYAQDATAGILIYDPSGVLTTPLNIGDNFKGLEGKVAFYGGVYEIIPTKASVTVTTSGNTITPPEMTLTQYNASYLNYESELIKLTDVYFPSADGSVTFPSSNNVNLTDGTTTIVFRTFATGESDIVGSVIPISHIKMTCIGGFFNTAVQVYSRTTSDFELLTGIEKTSVSDQIKLYPVPATSVLNVSGIQNLKSIEILDLAGKVIRTINTSTDEVIRIPVSNLRRGTYMLRFKTTDGTFIKKFVR